MVNKVIENNKRIFFFIEFNVFYFGQSYINYSPNQKKPPRFHGKAFLISEE
jgi:hypothetical protein